MKDKRNTEKRLDKAKKNRRIIIGFCALFMTCVLVFGATLVTVLTVRDSQSVVKYNGIMLDKGVASYLAATGKYSYMSYLDDIGVVTYDTESFWRSESESGESYGDELKRETELYIKSIVIGAYLFDRYTSLSKEDKKIISDSINETLEHKAEGDKKVFNELAAPMGFDFDDYSEGVQLSYKAAKAQSVIYGIDGAALASGAFLEECNKYYETYSHVKLLYVTTARTPIKDDEGKIKLDSDGKIATRFLTDEEIADRISALAEIRDLIDGYENDLDVQISPEYFELMQKKYNFDSSNIDTGYYFSDNSTYSLRFPTDTGAQFAENIGTGLEEQLIKVVNAAKEMESGEYREINGDFGVCFIYKYDNEPYAYQSGSYSAFFHDFYSNAADYLYKTTLEELKDRVEIRDSYYEIDLLTLPYNYLF